jgi:hypothetical protein
MPFSYITSDCHAVQDVLEEHHYTADGNRTVQAVLRAGTRQCCFLAYTELTDPCDRHGQ